jgi:hypothetical protein
MVDEVGPPRRLYFTVVDESGKELPAVEYWAGSPDEDEPAFQVIPLRRFVKLLGIGESLEEIGDGVFSGIWSGRRFVRVQLPGSLLRRAQEGAAFSRRA